MPQSTSSYSSRATESTGAAERISYWVEKLSQYCAAHGLPEPIYHIGSDRRGGRTAWSQSVQICGHCIPARFWYDGQYIHNAKEDAAQVALEKLEKGWLQILLEQLGLYRPQQQAFQERTWQYGERTSWGQQANISPYQR